MPIYEYACPDCGHKFDVLQKMSDPPVTVCPACAGTQVRKLISATSFVLKGGGWYKDLYGLKPGGSEGGGSASARSESAKAASAPKTEGAKTEGAKAASAPKTDASPSTPSASASASGSSASSKPAVAP